jgi:hypothetical protein
MTHVLHSAVPPVPAPLVSATTSRLVTGLRLLFAVLLVAGVLSTASAVGAIPDRCSPAERPYCTPPNTGDTSGNGDP